MTINDYILDVRRCIDEEAQNASCISGNDSDGVMMDNIIRSRTRDAIYFVCRYAPVEILAGSSGLSIDYNSYTTGVVSSDDDDRNCTTVILPSDFIRLARVRGNGWHRSVQHPIRESSEEALTLMDIIATATADRPQAVLVNSSPQRLELYPKVDSFEMSIICVPETLCETIRTGLGNTTLPLPSKVLTPVVYYTAFLTLSAYRDSGAKTMYEIAQLAITNQSK